MSNSEAQLRTVRAEFERLQSELSKAVETRQQLEAQQAENESVRQEFARLTPNNTIYKLIGPCLVKQEEGEAKANVDKRLEFISAEINRIETTLKELSGRVNDKRLELVQLAA